MSKNIKVSEETYEKIKELSEENNMPMGDIIDVILSRSKKEDLIKEGSIVKDVKDVIKTDNSIIPLIQLISTIKEMNTPVSSVQNLIESYKAINVLQELFGNDGKNRIADTLFNYLMSDPNIQPVVNQVILKIFNMSEKWAEDGKDKEMSFKDWLAEQDINLASLD